MLDSFGVLLLLQEVLPAGDVAPHYRVRDPMLSMIEGAFIWFAAGNSRDST